MQYNPRLKALVISTKAIADAIREERRLIAEEARSYQKTVSQFATSKECNAYNQALRDFADSIEPDN